MSQKNKSDAPIDGCKWHGMQAELKRRVLRAILKVSKVPESRMEGGLLFQIAGTETTKECRWK